MTLSRYRQVVLLCPVAITGGPEAIHQFYQSVNAIGLDCHIIHMGSAHPIKIEGRKLIAAAPPSERLLSAYAEYGPTPTVEVLVDDNTLLVFPEALATYAKRVTGCGVAIWWLSVDNVMRHLQNYDAEAELGQIFGRRELIHLYQSVYARDWLRSRGAQRIYDLYDYTSPLFTAAVAASPSRAQKISYNAAKGSELAQTFFGQNSEFDALALRGFSKRELQAIFRERSVYIDFGHFPGKDRLPREAAVSGSIVFVHRKGSGASYDDFPLPDFFKFSEADIASGLLKDRVQAVINAPERFWEGQAVFRGLVAWEKQQFHDQVMRHWGMRSGI